MSVKAANITRIAPCKPRTGSECPIAMVIASFSFLCHGSELAQELALGIHKVSFIFGCTTRVCHAVQVLTPLQHARAFAHSGPHNIDVLAIASCVYEDLAAHNLTCHEDIQQLAARCLAVKAQATRECK